VKFYPKYNVTVLSRDRRLKMQQNKQFMKKRKITSYCMILKTVQN